MHKTILDKTSNPDVNGFCLRRKQEPQVQQCACGGRFYGKGNGRHEDWPAGNQFTQHTTT